MESKRPFARIAGWAALWLALGAVALFLFLILIKPMQSTMPSAFALTLVTLSALGVFVFVVASVFCSIIALSGMRVHGRKGILGPAAGGLTVAGLMLVPILVSMSSGFAEHSRLVRAREVPPRQQPVSVTSTSAPPATPIK